MDSEDRSNSPVLPRLFPPNPDFEEYTPRVRKVHAAGASSHTPRTRRRLAGRMGPRIWRDLWGTGAVARCVGGKVSRKGEGVGGEEGEEWWWACLDEVASWIEFIGDSHELFNLTTHLMLLPLPLFSQPHNALLSHTSLYTIPKRTQPNGRMDGLFTFKKAYDLSLSYKYLVARRVLMWKKFGHTYGPILLFNLLHIHFFFQHLGFFFATSHTSCTHTIIQPVTCFNTHSSASLFHSVRFNFILIMARRAACLRAIFHWWRLLTTGFLESRKKNVRQIHNTSYQRTV